MVQIRQARWLVGAWALVLTACAQSAVPSAPNGDASAVDSADVAAGDIAIDAASNPNLWQPVEMTDLYDLWVYDDGQGTIRALQFAEMGTIFEPDLQGISPVYYFYRYPAGSPAKIVQRGRASLRFGDAQQLQLVLEAKWSSQVTEIGQTLLFNLQAAAKGELALQTPDGPAVIYGRANGLP